MAIYALSDLHLHLSVDKPMDVFGPQWTDYVRRIRDNWQRTVAPDDVVLIAGDVSWATYIGDAHADFAYIEQLNGTKIISKGNHDYWWETVSKLNRYISEQGFGTIRFLHNNCFTFGDVAVCGAKGYNSPDESFTDEDYKFYNRELSRLELSLQQGTASGCGTLVAMLHYPPVPGSGFTELMKKYGVRLCMYGHLHGQATQYSLKGDYQGTAYRLTSADYLGFQPLKLFDRTTKHRM